MRFRWSDIYIWSKIWSKMAPSMAAVLQAPRKLCSFSYVLFVILLFYVLDVVSITVYDRHTLLNIGSFVAQRKPDFEFLNAGALFTDTASEPFVWAARSRPRKRRRKRGKRDRVLVRLRQGYPQGCGSWWHPRPCAPSMCIPASRGFHRHFQPLPLSVCGSLMLQKIHHCAHTKEK